MKPRLGGSAVALAGCWRWPGWGGSRLVKAVPPQSAGVAMPATRVKRGRVTITVGASGELQGGNSEMLAAPMIGGGDMAITYLREPGELVKAGDVVVEFDTTQQEYKLQEAEADLAEAEQQVIQAQADAEASEEETRYSLLSAEGDVKQAELECAAIRILPAILARENTSGAGGRQGPPDQANRIAATRRPTSAAAIAIQKAAGIKPRCRPKPPAQNIENMMLKAKTAGYVNIMQNTNRNILY